MEDTSNLYVQDFPIFAPMIPFDFNDDPEELADKTPWHMCLWRKGPEDPLPCSIPCGDFDNFIFHVKNTHGKNLRPKIDYCRDCEVVFKNRTEAVNHYLEKAIMFEDHPLILEGDGEQEGLASVFTQIKHIRNELLDQILFSEDLPPIETIDIRDDIPPEEGRDICDCVEGACCQ